MDSAREQTDSPDLNGTAWPIMSTSNGTGSKSGQGLLHKLFSRQASIPRLNNKSDMMDAPLYNVEDLTYSNFQVMPCPYIRPLENRLEPRVESAPRGHRRVVAGSAISKSRSKGESLRGAHSCPAINHMVETPECDLEASHITELAKVKLQGNIAAAATADSSHLKDWAYYIKCYSEVSFYTLLSDAACWWFVLCRC